MTDSIITGVVPILITPFDSQGRIDSDSLQNLIDFNISAGVHGLGVANGSEIFKLNETERKLVTKTVVDFAHSVGVSVEGELGCLGSLETGKGEAEDGHGFEGELSKDMLLTDPAEAADFVAKTKVDALAIAIGTSHGGTGPVGQSL